MKNSLPTNKLPNRIKTIEPAKAQVLSTESRSAYLGARGNSCDIKHKGLERLKYAYKSITHC